MNIPLFITLLLTLQIICWWVGKRSARSLTSQTDYFLGGKSVPFFPLMMTFLGGQVGGGLVLGSSQEAFRLGWWVLLYPLGQVLGMLWLSAGLGQRLASFGVPTVAQIFEKYYGSSTLKQLASLLSIVSLFMILVAQVLATRSFLAAIGLTNLPLFLLFWGLVLTYTGMGGFKAVIKTDLIQASFFLLAFALAIGVALSGEAPAALQATAVEVDPPSFQSLSGWLLMPLLFAALEQDMGQRCFAAKSERVLRRSAFVAGCLTFLTCLVPIYFGIAARSLDLGTSGSGGASILMLSMQALTSPVVASLVGAAVMAAILATSDSLLNAITSNLSQDFDWVQKKSLNVTRLLSMGIGGLALLFSFFCTNIVGIVIQAYELSVCTLIVPLLGALFSKRKGNLLSARLAIGSGFVGFFGLRLLPFEFPREGGALLLSLLGYAAGGLLFCSSRSTIGSKTEPGNLS